MSVELLKDDLKKNKIRRLYLLYGSEEYLKKYYIDRLEKSVLKDGCADFNKVVFENASNVDRIVDACETMPVFADRKLVIVKNLGLSKSSKKTGNAEGRKKSRDDSLVALLGNLPDYICLILCETDMDKRSKIVDLAKKNGLVVEFSLQKPAELVRWVVNVLKFNGKDIDNTIASQLVDRCEPGMNELMNEINKLVMYLEKRVKVTAEDIEKVCTKSVKSRIFDLTGAIAEKNGTKALKIFNGMIELKEPVPRILFMIARQFRSMLEVKLLKDRGISLEDLAAKTGMTTYITGKVLQQAKGFTSERLKQAMEECLEMDICIKTGKVDEMTAAELLIARYTM